VRGKSLYGRRVLRFRLHGLRVAGPIDNGTPRASFLPE